MEFLQAIVPDEGYICVARQLPNNQGFSHFFTASLEAASAKIKALDAAGETVYLAQATFMTPGSRKGDNAVALRTFFMDIDCGVGKPFSSQLDGVKTLKEFCAKINFPLPAVVSSGNGLYAHWLMDEDVPVAMWRNTARMFQQVVKQLAPGLDGDGIMADAARVLRPVGSTHRKDPTNPKPVKLIANSAPIAYANFSRLVLQAAKTSGVETPALRKPDPNKEFTLGLDGPPSSAHLITQHCQQMQLMKARRGDIPEPLWYSLLGVLRCTTEAATIVHEWSNGHPDYTPENTNTKVQQWADKNIGATSCTKIGAGNTGCLGCIHLGRITSPLELGREKPEPLQREEYPDAPTGYILSDKGVVYGAIPDIKTLYPYPIWVKCLNRDFFGESMTLRHKLPHDGWIEVNIQSSLVTDSKKFHSALMDNHIHVLGKDEKGLFMHYIEAYMQKVRAMSAINKLVTRMGWHGTEGEMSFSVGRNTFNADGTHEECGYSSATPDLVQGLEVKGVVQPWVDATDILNTPGLEGLAFEFLAMAFGAPLVEFSGYEGAMLSVVGDSGVGKTLTAKWGLSAWGNPDKLLLMRDDTRNALVTRLGVYGSLPAYIDEVSNIAADDLSELVYRVTQGRDKLRLTKDAREKKQNNSWRTLAVTTSNQPLYDKLAALKGDASAEMNRVFEYEVYGGYDKLTGAKIAKLAQDNYGGVGREYAKYLVAKQHMLKAGLERFTTILDQQCRGEVGERFWLMLASTALYGGLIASKLGLCKIDVSRLIPWVSTTINNMRGFKKSSTFDACSWLGNFLDQHASDIIVVGSYNPDDKIGPAAYREPRSKLIGRIEEDRRRLWISSYALRKELMREHISTRKFALMLQDTPGGPALVGTVARMTLGRGTVYKTIAQTCWEIDLNHPALGHQAIMMVKNAQAQSMPHKSRGEY